MGNVEQSDNLKLNIEITVLIQSKLKDIYSLVKTRKKIIRILNSRFI